MALITRISRLFQADFHAVLDSIEEPELMLRQAIRDMEDDLAARERHIQLATSEQQQLRSRKDELTRSLEALDDELDLCFRSQKPDLARKLVRRKLETQRLAKHLAGRVSALERQLAGQRATVDEHRMTLDGLRQKSEILSRHAEPVDGNSDAFGREFAITDDEVEVAFLREQGKRSAS